MNQSDVEVLDVEIYEGAEGFLFIGDPHVSSKKPGRRKDPNFLGTALGKLEAALEMANQQNLVPLILGDLTDEPQDTHPVLLVQLIRMFKASRHVPICLVGNHDCHELSLTHDTVLAIMRESGALHVIDAAGPVGMFKLGDSIVGVGASPYGHETPDNVTGLFPANADQVVWMTHADWAFEGAYPGSRMPYPIEGCSLVVNGHMHRTMKSVQMAWPEGNGETTYFNPGNLIRQSTADAQHVPSAWEWRPEFVECLRHEMDHEADPFDWTGLQVKPMPEGALDHLVFSVKSDLESSRFVSGLKAELSSEMPVSEGADILREDMDELMASGTYDEDVKALLHDLYSACFGTVKTE